MDLLDVSVSTDDLTILGNNESSTLTRQQRRISTGAQLAFSLGLSSRAWYTVPSKLLRHSYKVTMMGQWVQKTQLASSQWVHKNHLGNFLRAYINLKRYTHTDTHTDN